MADAALDDLIDRVREAGERGSPLCIRGGGTKDFYGETPQGTPLHTRSFTGVGSYEPTELVITVRAGTKVSELEAVLAQQGQCLPFEPPRFGAHGTVGGMVAAGLSGPSRAAVGALREYVLGATMINGRAQFLRFGGTVMKNVAGYDVSRLLAGSMGILGVICEVSLKVLPIAPAQTTLRFEADEPSALARLHAWGGRPLPINASAWWNGMLVVRLRGANAAVQAATQALGGERIDAQTADKLWTGLRDHDDDFFRRAVAALDDGPTLWRLSVPQVAPPLGLAGEQLIEWGGAQRWLCSTLPVDAVRDAVAAVGGHATMFRAVDKSAGAFTPLQPPLDRIHRQVKQAFDPDGLFNPGRLRV